MNVHQSSKSEAFLLQTSKNNLKPSKNEIKVQQIMATIGSYVHIKVYGNIFCNLLKILMVSDKMIHKDFRTHATL